MSLLKKRKTVFCIAQRDEQNDTKIIQFEHCFGLNENSDSCFRFDKSLCWYNVTFGEKGHRTCPFTFCTSIPGCDRIACKLEFKDKFNRKKLHIKNDIFGKIMKNGVFFVFTACSESL